MRRVIKRIDLSSVHQRDSGQALNNALLMGGMIFIVVYLFVLFIQAAFLKHGFHGDVVTSFFGLLVYLTDIQLLARLFKLPYEGADIIRYFGQYAGTISIVNYVGIGLGMLGGWFIGKDEYANMSFNEKMEGAIYYDNHVEARQNFVASMEKEILSESKTDKCTRDEAAGVVIAGVQISKDRETKHLICVGKTGGGKTVALRPMMQSAIDRNDICIAFDQKGDFTSSLVDSSGKMPILSAPWDKRGSAWDVARDVTTPAAAAELATRLIADSGGDPMWGEGARQILTGLIVCLQQEMEDKWDFTHLAELLRKSTEEISETVIKYHPEARRVVELQVNQQTGQKEASKTVQSLMITMSAQLSGLFRLADAYAQTGAASENEDEKPRVPKFSIRDFVDGKYESNTLILQHNETYADFARMINQSIISALSGYVNSNIYPERPPHKRGVWLFLDEFIQLGKADMIRPYLAVGRSKGLRVVLGFQDFSQLGDVFGNQFAMDTIKNSFQTYIYCSLSPESAQFASKSCGDKIVQRFEISRDGTGMKTGESWHRSVEPVAPEAAFYEGLGRCDDGVQSMVYPVGGDVFRLMFPFPTKRVGRPGNMEAAWIKTGWEKREAQKLKEAMETKQQIAKLDRHDRKARFKNDIGGWRSRSVNLSKQESGVQESGVDEDDFILPGQEQEPVEEPTAIEPDDIMPPVDEIDINTELQPDDDKPDDDDFLPPI